MRVKDIMVRTAASCAPRTNLGAAVEILWNRNCGILPIINEEEKVIGVVTDRDLCVALGTRNRLPGEVTVGEVTTGKVYSCSPNDDVHAALKIMASEKVRRLPVVNDDGRLEGILSMDDVVLHSEPRSSGRFSELAHDDVLETLKMLYRPELPRVARQDSIAA